MFTSVWKTMKENKFEVDNEINNDLICVICKSLMIKACQSPCGCRFCSDCIEHHLEGNDKFCPGTGRFCQIQNINYANDITLDNAINIRIAEIIVKCPRKDCQFKDALCVIDNHMRTCSKRPISCPYNSIGCEMTEVSNDEIKEHFIENNYCHSKLLIDLINNLRNELGSLRSEMIELKREHKHKFDVIELQSTNQQKILEMERKEMDNTQEIMMLNEEMAALKNVNRSLREEMTEIKQYIEMIKVESIPQIELINKEMTAVKNDNRLIRKQMEIDAESNKEIRQQIEANETKSQQQMNELKQNYQQQRQQEENKIAEMEKCANEIRLSQTKLEYENFVNFGFFNGRIEKLSQQKNEYIYSKPFYSGPSGYKMCLAVFISDNGDIAVRFHLMRGESDDKLNWPVKLAVTVDVINPADGNVWRSETIKYSDCPDYAGWRKPINDRNDPICVNDYDYNKYYNINYCYNNIIRNNSAAIKNDLLLLKCKIDKL